MKKLRFLFILALSLVVFACGQKGEKKVEKEEIVTTVSEDEESFPEGYPEEFILPEGFTPGDVKTGEGSITGGGETRTYKTFFIEKMMPNDRGVLVEHFKKLSEDQGWQGDWRFYDDGLGASGTFKVGEKEVEVKITEMLFTFTIKVFD